MLGSLIALTILVALWIGFSISPRNGTWDRRALSLLALPAGGLLALFRSHFDDASTGGTVRAFTVVFGLILLVTLGRPALMFDLDSVDHDAVEPAAVASPSEATDQDRDETKVARTQFLVLGLLILGVIIYSVADLRFLD